MKFFTELTCFNEPDSKSLNNIASCVQHLPGIMRKILKIISVLNNCNKGILFSYWNVNSLEMSQKLYQIQELITVGFIAWFQKGKITQTYVFHKLCMVILTAAGK